MLPINILFTALREYFLKLYRAVGAKDERKKIPDAPTITGQLATVSSLAIGLGFGISGAQLVGVNLCKFFDNFES